MDIRDRIKQIMEREGLAAGVFAENIGVAQATISHILGGRNKYPSMEVILKLHKRYSDINWEWLLTGIGPMSNADGDMVETDNAGGNGATGRSATSPAVTNGEEPAFEYPSLFPENRVNAGDGTAGAENRGKKGLENPVSAPKETVIEKIVYKERPPRNITEIRIFFDDNTYEIFTPVG
ncbi:MAG: helix-turn-helix transcriptional regulator [Prevotellaceae bacterium]|nr:helix-turn-helix transcriptional regulator [Prevotellaceae bacterium]